DDIEDSVLQARLVKVLGGAQPLAHGVDGDEVGVIEAVRRKAFGFCGIDLRQGASAQVGGGVQPIGGVVVEAVRVVSSEEQRDRGVEDAQFVEVGIGDGINNRRVSAGCHEETLSAR